MRAMTFTSMQKQPSGSCTPTCRCWVFLMGSSRAGMPHGWHSAREPACPLPVRSAAGGQPTLHSLTSCHHNGGVVMASAALGSPTVAAPPAPLLSDLGASTDSGDGSWDSGLDDGAELGSQEEYDPTADRHRSKASKTTKSNGKGKKCSVGQVQQLASCISLPPACLHLSDFRVCCGSAGEVVLGTCRGAAAVVKLLGPDSTGLAAFAQEWQMYAELHSVQGQLVPSLLAAGHLWAGVHFIATSRIDGVPLSSLTCIPEVVAVAAVKSLKTLYTAFPGFVHGDVRLANVLLVSESSDAAPWCMWVDLARSRLDGTQKQREAELRKLKKLLGM